MIARRQTVSLDVFSAGVRIGRSKADSGPDQILLVPPTLWFSSVFYRKERLTITFLRGLYCLGISLGKCLKDQEE